MVSSGNLWLGDVYWFNFNGAITSGVRQWSYDFHDLNVCLNVYPSAALEHHCPPHPISIHQHSPWARFLPLPQETSVVL